ncbi:aspartate carbamoyltransferase regulatory subunit [Candidatus Palibaumannia cicadellinicola]|uniref:Aspartate carbamoyltransferase regulatory chain n=1 Tax=Baumannia cicadellinicola subsp. Homalodisca coagulata TaxID=374463 RepID=PYRI_BAUCH|nr:aspartate carbamoyltransferase regulatory subunit [Candidatus Baumannia cicadellinicola]Q1LTK5.1 RecName: Full=Aspartate carbamoyltransferase regulatory chain [Baumannia cicadellinicola str. Hc (Homalodisca coagulata)]ABF14102.1 aspartate carbamoyltransferase, regulatory subunit [Baumannia cicadellinicola str. Hc (Homalodisca coagulata)]MBS0032702.1 aspartate carbamoyltransferase regulatory subunit [Candidatus Baumannia cicadellinicola]MCJ7462308.1 aspartate carbamoyltransferase regulatory s
MHQYHKLQVEAIYCGTVIDHIPAQVGIKLLSWFKLTATDERITIGLNLPSNKQGKKDLIKIENVLLTEEQANQLAIYAPYATVNRIANYNVVCKRTLTLPESIANVFICPNSNCVSRSEPVASGFIIKTRGKQIHLKCKYCEKVFERRAVESSNLK